MQHRLRPALILFLSLFYPLLFRLCNTAGNYGESRPERMAGQDTRKHTHTHTALETCWGITHRNRNTWPHAAYMCNFHKRIHTQTHSTHNYFWCFVINSSGAIVTCFVCMTSFSTVCIQVHIFYEYMFVCTRWVQSAWRVSMRRRIADS